MDDPLPVLTTRGSAERPTGARLRRGVTWTREAESPAWRTSSGCGGSGPEHCHRVDPRDECDPPRPDDLGYWKPEAYTFRLNKRKKYKSTVKQLFPAHKCFCLKQIWRLRNRCRWWVKVTYSFIDLGQRKVENVKNIVITSCWARILVFSWLPEIIDNIIVLLWLKDWDKYFQREKNVFIWFITKSCIRFPIKS